jgi:hypothetical protein
MKKKFLFLFISLLSIHCSFSSSAYDKEIKKCENQQQLSLLFIVLVREESLQKNESKEASEVNMILASEVLFNQGENSCKNRVAKMGYVNGPLP